MALHNEFGKKGEIIAKEFLLGKGYEIKCSNWVWEKAEIDIIAFKNESLVFTEVKTRTGNFFGNPEEFVTRSKERNLERASAAYIEEKGHTGEIRFDIIAITFFKNGLHEVHHIEDAFFPGM